MRTPASALAVAVVCLVVVACAAAAQQPAPHAAEAAAPIRTVASTLDVMKTMTIPFSNAVFKAASRPPADEEGWTSARAQAAALAESANLLMIGDRVRDRGAWLTLSRAQVDAAEAAARAATAKNADALSSAADALYDTCANCHAQYPPG